jgi:hypothetical protein
LAGECLTREEISTPELYLNFFFGVEKGEIPSALAVDPSPASAVSSSPKGAAAAVDAEPEAVAVAALEADADTDADAEADGEDLPETEREEVRRAGDLVNVSEGREARIVRDLARAERKWAGETDEAFWAEDWMRSLLWTLSRVSGQGVVSCRGIHQSLRFRKKGVHLHVDGRRIHVRVKTHFSHPSKAAMPTKAARSSERRSFPFPGAVRLRSVDRIAAAMGMAGWVAEGKRGRSSAVDMAMTQGRDDGDGE